LNLFSKFGIFGRSDDNWRGKAYIMVEFSFVLQARWKAGALCREWLAVYQRQGAFFGDSQSLTSGVNMI